MGGAPGASHRSQGGCNSGRQPARSRTRTRPARKGASYRSSWKAVARRRSTPCGRHGVSGVSRPRTVKAAPDGGECRRRRGDVLHHVDRAHGASRRLRPVLHGDPSSPAWVGRLDAHVRRPQLPGMACEGGRPAPGLLRWCGHTARRRRANANRWRPPRNHRRAKAPCATRRPHHAPLPRGARRSGGGPGGASANPSDGAAEARR